MSTNVATTCRDIKELLPIAQTACNLFLSECKKQGVDVFITETYRSQDRQNYLFAQGRTEPGKIVTWTKSSRHTSRLAWDIACNGNNLYDKSILTKAGQIAAKLGITWGGTWSTPDMPHFEIESNWKPPKGSVDMTKDEAIVIIREKCKFDDNTMLYLQMYRYSGSMITRLASAIARGSGVGKSITKDEALKVIKGKCGFDENTMLYLEMYRYSESMIIRLAEQMIK